MARYIDADALENDLEKRWDVSDDSDFCNKEVWRAIEEAPTADVVEVVRCKDCKFYDEDEKWCRRLGLCGAFDANDFCSHGEMKDDDSVK